MIDTVSKCSKPCSIFSLARGRRLRCGAPFAATKTLATTKHTEKSSRLTHRRLKLTRDLSLPCSRATCRRPEVTAPEP
jgi:hypothetical protein